MGSGDLECAFCGFRNRSQYTECVIKRDKWSVIIIWGRLGRKIQGFVQTLLGWQWNTISFPSSAFQECYDGLLPGSRKFKHLISVLDYWNPTIYKNNRLWYNSISFAIIWYCHLGSKNSIWFEWYNSIITCLTTGCFTSPDKNEPCGVKLFSVCVDCLAGTSFESHSGIIPKGQWDEWKIQPRRKCLKSAKLSASEMKQAFDDDSIFPWNISILLCGVRSITFYMKMQ